MDKQANQIFEDIVAADEIRISIVEGLMKGQSLIKTTLWVPELITKNNMIVQEYSKDIPMRDQYNTNWIYLGKSTDIISHKINPLYISNYDDGKFVFPYLRITQHFNKIIKRYLEILYTHEDWRK